MMNILLVYAHPEPKSLNGSLKDFAVKHLEASGHKVQVSDLYAMRWKATLDTNDSTEPLGDFFDASLNSKRAYEQGTQTPDITAEQAKLGWADMVILQFPLWWYSMPAILKGWVDRVYAYGFAYGVGEHSDNHWGDRFGEGMMLGKKAMLIVTVGGWESHYSARGINGPINDILFPIQHGILYYPGFEVLPPFVVYKTHKIDATKYKELCAQLVERLDTIATTPPIAFRAQNKGDYEIPALTLKDDIAPDKEGFSIHIN